MKKFNYISILCLFLLFLHSSVCISQPSEKDAAEIIVLDYSLRIIEIKKAIAKKGFKLTLAYIDEKSYKDPEARLMVEIAESAYEQVGKEMHLLETEITHYYKGKVPKKLRSMIIEADKSYTDAKIAALKAVE